jgi:hypothetical protein
LANLTIGILQHVFKKVYSCSQGMGPPNDNAACRRLNPDWGVLKASFFRVNSTRTVAEIEAFAAAETVPEGTGAVGLFAGACRLSVEPFKPSGLVIVYCGRGPAAAAQPASVGGPAVALAPGVSRGFTGDQA